MNLFIRFSLLFLFSFSALWADTLPLAWYTKDAEQKPILHIELFMASTCPHCHKEDAFLKSIEASYPWIQVHRHIINQDKKALVLFGQLLAEQKMTDFAVPSTYICNARWTGFKSAETTGKDLLRVMNYCKEAIEKEGALSSNTVNVLRQQALASKGKEVISPFTTLKTISIVGLLDTINPCSFFILLAFCGILFMPLKQKERVGFGLLFVLTVAVTHALQQIFMAFYFTLLPWLLVPALLIGLFSIYTAQQYYKTRQISSWFFLETLLLAFIVLLYQQSCTRNLSFLFEQWLHHQHFSRPEIVFYEIIYQSVYILPLLLILLIYSLLIEIKRLKPIKRGFNAAGLLFIGLIGLILIIYPRALSSVFLSFIVFFIGVVGAWALRRRMREPK